MGIFAKQPIAGQTKTRLALGISTERALQIAEAFLDDVLSRLQDVAVHRVIAYAPSGAKEYLTRWVSQGYELVPQGEGDLGERLQRFFDHLRGKGARQTVVIGSDSPTLPIAYIDQAFAALESNDVVLGPSFDGGYYLVGNGRRAIPMFEGISWSTSKVLEETIERLRKADARLALLPPWYDVDTVEDWAMLRGHVRAMRLAGIDPGVPRIERLLQET